jgi:hypothetical protein
MRPTIRKSARTAAIAALTVAALAASINFTSGEAPVVQAAIGGTLGAGGEYHPLEPTRIFDTRTPALDVAPLGAKASVTNNTSAGFDVQISGLGGLPAFADANGDGADDNVLAVAVNITVISPTQLGYLQAYGKGASPGESSVVNFAPGGFVPNMAILRPGAGGKLTLHLVSPLRAGTSHIAIDIFGWFSSSSYTGGASGGRGARVVPVGPARVYDSRLDAFGGTPLGSQSTVTIPVRGADSYEPVITDLVPDNSNVVGVMVNITGVNWLPLSAPTFIAVVPDALAPGEEPTTSNLNLVPGQVRSVMGILPVGADGKIRVFNLGGEVDIVVDVLGYLVDGATVGTRSGRVVPLVQPYRAFDTRLASFGNRPLGPGMAEPFNFGPLVDSVKIGSEPVGAQLGVIGNLTATDLKPQYAGARAATFLTAYPPAGTPPQISNITITEGETLPNLTLLRFGADPEAAAGAACSTKTCVMFYNLAGYLHYLYDVSAVILSD